MTHTSALSYGAHEWWVSDFGTARNPFPGQTPPSLDNAPFLQSLSPVYQTFPIHGAVTVGTPGNGARFAAREALFGLHPRPDAVGFDKRRKFRWQELLNARAVGDAKTLSLTREGYRGAVAALVANAPGENGGALWAAFTPSASNAAFYTQPVVRRVLRETLLKMRRGVLLQEGGSRTFTAFQGQNVIVGARVASQKPSGALSVRLRALAPGAKTATFEKVWPVNVKAGQSATVSASFRPTTWPRGGFRVVTQVLEGKRVLDEVSHDLNVWIPKKNPQFMTVQNGEFRLNGKRWKANGVNYMPSSGIGIIDNDVFEKWISAPAYDPEVIERDLRHVRAMGFNSVSAFVYYDERHDTNTVDFLRRCENLGLKVNLSLRPGVWSSSTPPMEFHWSETRSLIEESRLAENDTVFVYDIAWEPSHYDNKFQQGYIAWWTDWVKKRYDTIEKAEATWGVPMPRNAGEPTVPPMEQLTTDGPWRVLAADYRVFLDGLTHEKYGEPRRLIKSIDPNHGVSFRMQFSGDPTFNTVGLLPFDFYGLRNAVDVWEPEGYGLIGDWETVKTGRITIDYARLNNPELPVMYAEAGSHVWNMAAMAPDEERLTFNGRFYRDIYRMLRESDADGIYFWWYPGGFRVAEGSDYGLANSDGTMRPQTQAIIEEGPKFLASPKLPAPNVFIPIERDRDARGLNGMYESVRADYWRAIAEGKRPALRWQREPQGARGALQR